MSRGTYKHMLAVAKKKKPLKDIIDNLDKYSIEDLKTVKGQPEWIRKHLVDHKKTLEKRAAGYLTPEEIAAVMVEKSRIY